MTVKERLAEYGHFLDVGILRHGFAAHMRDYDVVAVGGSWRAGRFRLVDRLVDSLPGPDLH